jgi:uncharacterized protein
MPRWIAIFEDNEEAAWVREKHSKDHFSYLQDHSAKICIAGGLRENPGGPFLGGLWVMDVLSRDEAARLCENDPYFKLGLRRSYRLMAWGKAPCYADVIL